MAPSGAVGNLRYRERERESAGARDRERERDGEREKETDRQTDRQSGGPMGSDGSALHYNICTLSCYSQSDNVRNARSVSASPLPLTESIANNQMTKYAGKRLHL